MICSSTQTSHPKFNLNSHLDEQMGNLPVMREWKVNVEEGIKAAKKGTKKQKEQSLTTSDSHQSTKPSDDLSIQMICSSSSVKVVK